MANPRYNTQTTNRRGAMGGGVAEAARKVRAGMKKGGKIPPQLKKFVMAKKKKAKMKKIMAGKGLYANIHAKRKRGGKMRKKGAKGAPKASDFKRAKQTARK